MSALADLLTASGWLTEPSDLLQSECSQWPAPGTDLLPALIQANERPTVARRVARHASSLLSGLRIAQRDGAQLTFGWPGAPAQVWSEWLGSRWLWWPRGVPRGRRVAWISSRLGRAIDERTDWFAVLRTATAKFQRERDLLLTASHTATDRFLERAASLFGLPLLRVNLEERRSCVDWMTRLRRAVTRQGLLDSEAVKTLDPPSFADVFLSPPMDEIADGAPPRPLNHTPVADRLLVLLAEQLVALQVRPRGNLHQLLRARLTDSRFPSASVWLALGDSLTPSSVADDLQPLGAIGWWLTSPHVNTRKTSRDEVVAAEVARIPSPILAELPWGDGEYLVHWTRRRDGPWPDQSETEFLDDVLQARDSASRSALAALARMVRQRRLIASSAAIRGGYSVVSFSERPLSELVRQRTYRRHRRRWDAEPFGLCIRRDWLVRRGAQPVRYGDDETWASLPDRDRPFFQQRYTRSRRGSRRIDWSREREWRVRGDLDLSAASGDDVTLFVADVISARQLAAISPWPILVCARTGT